MKALLLLLLLASCTLQEVQNTASTIDVSNTISQAKEFKSACGEIETQNTSSYNNCVQTIAVARKNPELCKYLLDQKSDNPLYLPESIACVYAVVNVTKDPAYCETLNGSNTYAIPYRETCTHYARSD